MLLACVLTVGEAFAPGSATALLGLRGQRQQQQQRWLRVRLSAKKKKRVRKSGDASGFGSPKPPSTPSGADGLLGRTDGVVGSSDGTAIGSLVQKRRIEKLDGIDADSFIQDDDSLMQVPDLPDGPRGDGQGPRSSSTSGGGGLTPAPIKDMGKSVLHSQHCHPA